MPKSSIDELIAAIKAVQLLEKTVAKHDQAIERIVDKLDDMQRRLDDLSKAPRP